MDHGALSLSRPPNVRTLMTGPVIHTSREIQPCVDLGWEESPRPRFSRMADGGWRMADGRLRFKVQRLRTCRQVSWLTQVSAPGALPASSLVVYRLAEATETP